jgi:hypothetical protein
LPKFRFKGKVLNFIAILLAAEIKYEDIGLKYAAS